MGVGRDQGDIRVNASHTDPPGTLSPRTRADLRTAMDRVIGMSFPDSTVLDWPTALLQASLTRDGDHLVLDDLSGLAAMTVRSVSELSGESFTAVLGRCHSVMTSGGVPFSADSWTRAQCLTLHRLGEPIHIQGGPIEAIDLASALVLLHVLGTLQVIKAQSDALRARKPHRPPKRRKKPRKR